ncbi:MAG: hypothetical protein AAF196_17660, partial [Planctomycetota bacterium]
MSATSTTVIQHDYLGLVRSKDFETLTSAWDDAIQNVSSIDSNAVETYCQTIIQLCDRQARDTALDLATRMVTALTQASQFDPAIKVGIALIRKEAHNEPFARQVLQVIESLHGDAPWYSNARSASGLTDEQPRPDAFIKFDRARRITPDNVVTHQDHRHSGGADGVDHQVRLCGAVEDEPDVELLGQPERGRDVLGAVRGHDEGDLAREDGAHRLQREVARRLLALLGGRERVAVLLRLDQLRTEHRHHRRARPGRAGPVALGGVRERRRDGA